MYYSFIALVSFHHRLQNKMYYTFIALVSSRYRLKNEIYYMHFLQKFLTTLLSIPGELTYNFERYNLVSGDITSGETDFWAT